MSCDFCAEHRKLSALERIPVSVLPSLFISHGSPMFAIEPGLSGPKLRALGASFPRPQAIVVLSPHWMTDGDRVHVCAVDAPQTLHDFGGFDRRLNAIHYPAPGAPVLARRIASHLNECAIAASESTAWGLDHGTWVPLTYLFPEADVPVLQISMPSTLTPQRAHGLGKALAPLAGEGVLLIGTGSLTHNLYEVQWHAHAQMYAKAFDAWVCEAVSHGDEMGLVETMTRAPHAQRAHPTIEHLLPLMFAVGAAPAITPATILNGEILHSVISMTSFAFGRAPS